MAGPGSFDLQLWTAHLGGLDAIVFRAEATCIAGQES